MLLTQLVSNLLIYIPLYPIPCQLVMPMSSVLVDEEHVARHNKAANNSILYIRRI